MIADPIHLLAFDLGAESGRAMLGRLDDRKLKLEELHRFANRPVRVGNSIYWDTLTLWDEIKHGLAKAAQASRGSLVSLGLDTWGVDFGLLAADDSLLGNPVHYRDQRTDGMMEAAYEIVPRPEIYAATGIQFMQLNSLYQLLAMVKARSPILAAAKTMLTMPDLFNFWLTGRKATEFTIATTTQCYNPIDGEWAWGLLDRLGIPKHIFQPIVSPGTILEKLHPAVIEETDCPPISVIAPACHDTGSAVAAVPAVDPDYIFLSSGTWSLMGIEVPRPIITADSLRYDITNEGGVNGTYRFLKNITGMWPLQECRREWARGGKSFSYDELTMMAADAPGSGALMLPGDPRFLHSGGMPARIQGFCQESGQKVPQTIGEIARCILESLAMEYRWVAERLDDLGGRRMHTIHIIGGGSRNRLLNQLTADVTNRRVVAGPVEATAIGNLLVQALALGQLNTLEDARAVVRNSFDVVAFEPRDGSLWDGAYLKYLNLRESRLAN